MITSEEELRQKLPQPNKQAELQPKFRRMIDRVITSEDPAQREIAAQRLSEILAKIAVAFAEPAGKDSLTHLLNKGAFIENLGHTLTFLRRFNLPAALIFVDVDHLKRFNDTLGHQRADQMLVTEADCITSSTRSVDSISRFGGDEFVICVVGADLDGGELVAQRIEAASKRRMSEIFPDYSYPHTLSIGVAELMPNDTPDILMERADKAMYEAKRERDRIISVKQDPQSGKWNYKVVAPIEPISPVTLAHK